MIWAFSYHPLRTPGSVIERKNYIGKYKKVDNSLQHSPLCPCRNINWVIDRSQKSRDFFLSSTSREPVINILESQCICCIQSTTWLHCSQRATCTHNWQDKSVLPICTHYNFHATLLHLLISPWDSCLVLRDLLFLHIIMHNEQTLFSPPRQRQPWKAPGQPPCLRHESPSTITYINQASWRRSFWLVFWCSSSSTSIHRIEFTNASILIAFLQCQC